MFRKQMDNVFFHFAAKEDQLDLLPKFLQVGFLFFRRCFLMVAKNRDLHIYIRVAAATKAAGCGCRIYLD